MSARFLAWYSTGVLSLSFVLLLFVGVAPGGEAGFSVLQMVVAGAAITFGAAAVVLSTLPAGHWSNRSFAVRCFLAFAAIVSSLFLLGGVLG